MSSADRTALGMDEVMNTPLIFKLRLRMREPDAKLFGFAPQFVTLEDAARGDMVSPIAPLLGSRHDLAPYGYWRAMRWSSANGKRRVPIHLVLEDDGLLAFVLSHEEEILFGSANHPVGSAPAHLTRSVRTFIPIKLRPDLMPDHGWRHLFQDLCRRDSLPEEARSYITGAHGKQSILLRTCERHVKRVISRY